MDFKILRVNMATRECRFEDIPEQYAGLGGRGLTSAIVAAEVEPTCGPLGPNNKLVFAPGLLGGTNCANSNRISVGCKSPMTGGIKEANSGGEPGGHMARMGLAAVVIEDMAEEGSWWQLELGVGQAKLVPAMAAGLNNYDAVGKLIEKYGKDCSYISIGRAGEFKLTAASIAFTDRELRPSRHAGRGGVGAVMGAKGLKAIIINPAGGSLHPLADPDSFKSAAKRFAQALMDHPVCGQGLPTYGTAVLVNILHEAGGLPTRNFSVGRFEGHDAVSGETMNQLTKERGGEGVVAHGCMTGCIMRCSGIFPDKKGKAVGKWPEYETLWAFGPNSGISDIDMIARYDRMCDDVGVDTIDVGAALALFMEAGVLKFGDAEGALKLLEEISTGSAIGRVLGCGTAVTGKVYGLRRVPVVKGQSMPAYDPRAVKGQGVTYATSPMGADHTAGYAVTSNILGIGGTVDPLSKEGQLELSRNLQIATASVDTAGLCLFVAFAALDNPDALQAIVDMLNAKYGLTLGLDAVVGLGKKVLDIEIDFNRRAGLTEAADRLPDYFYSEKFKPHNVRFDITPEELDSVLSW
ncbi:MAG: aldehyde ferredoxin oxidoreductase [Deltaproteobacteria bacterium]|jgi:aldehyde:ferredoxin oxidoreductase|nr:aldehyde ferredoxin oxidoreductase [Deltaproteobacteria bacterium]